MKRRLYLSLPIVLAGAYAYWTSTPRIKNQEYLDLLAIETRAHLKVCQRQALSQVTNGAISPIFEDYWQSTGGSESSSELRILVEAMRAQSIYHEPDLLDQEFDTERKAELRNLFRAKLSSLHPELVKPVFFTGKIGFNSSDLSRDFLDCQNLARALSGEASALALDGDTEGFLRCIRSILGLSRGYRAFPLLIRMMISQGISDIALQTVICAYSPSDEAAPWGEISRLILAAVPSRDEMVLCMKCEFAFGDAFYKDVLEGKIPIDSLAELGEELPFWKRLPGQVSREYRSYRCDGSAFVAALESGQSTSALGTDLAKKFDGYLSRLGVLHDFHKTTALVCEALDKRADPGFQISHLTNFQELSPSVEVVGRDVSFVIEDGEVGIDIVSSHWVESANRKVLFRMGGKTE